MILSLQSSSCAHRRCRRRFSHPLVTRPSFIRVSLLSEVSSAIGVRFSLFLSLFEHVRADNIHEAAAAAADDAGVYRISHTRRHCLVTLEAKRARRKFDGRRRQPG